MATTERRRPARERLLTAADELMFVEGVVLTPVDVILRRAGASPATLYANFGNKDGLIAAALERRLAEWTEVWDAALAAAALSESTPPCMGIVTVRSDCVRVRRDRPSPSVPTTRASRSSESCRSA